MFSPTMMFIIGAAVVIALIALVIVPRVVRARKNRMPAPAEPAFLETPPEWASGPDTWPADNEPAAPDDAEPAVVAAPGVAALSALVAAPGVAALPAVEDTIAETPTVTPPLVVWETPVPSPTTGPPPAVPMSEFDPVMILVKALLQTSGELNPAEFRRLELYRPQRIVDAADTLAPQMTGRANESKRTRLQRIRHYAISLMAEFESEESGIPGNAVTSNPATAEAAAISGLSLSDTAQILPPEDWGTSMGGSELALDPELSLLHDELTQAPEPEESPAPEPEESPAPQPEGTPAREPEEIDAPAQEQSADDLTSMSPRELGQALASSDDAGFKKTAIDALERLGTPEALSQLQHSLEDRDPDVQLYALSAAERLLGR